MARLASDAKMGFYPTPYNTLHETTKVLRANKGSKVCLLDPCCGEGKALRDVASSLFWTTAVTVTYGVEQDTDRAVSASKVLDRVINCSVFDARINPLGSIGLLWLNPPYGSEGGERYEMRFLKHAIKWLCKDGILVFLVPESLFENEANRLWVASHFADVRVFRFHPLEYPRFKQVVLFGRKRAKLEDGEVIPPPPYPYINLRGYDVSYFIPETAEPEVFQGSEAVTDEEVWSNRSRLLEEVAKITGSKEGIRRIKPLLPLRKGHLVALLTAGFLDGRVETPEGPIWLRGFSERVSFTRVEDDKEITRHTYSVGIRVIEQGGRWYDIK